MKKTRKKLTDTLDQVIVVNDLGEELTFLNGVKKMTTGGRFIAAKSPIDGQLSLIIEDYVYYMQNIQGIEAWMKLHETTIKQAGMMIYFENDADRTMFLLRWG